MSMVNLMSAAVKQEPAMSAAVKQEPEESMDVKMEDVSRKRAREEAIQEFDRACKKVNVDARTALERRVGETKRRELLYGIPGAGIRNKDVNLKHKFQFLTVVIRDGMRVTAGEDTDDYAVVVKARPQHFAKRMMMAWNLCNPDANEGTNFFFRGRLLSEYHMLMDVPGFCDEEAATVLRFPKGKRPPQAQEEVNPPLRLTIRDVFRRSSVDYIVRKNDRLEKVSNHWMGKHCKQDQGARIYDFETTSGNKRMAPTMKFEEVGLTTSNSVILTMAAGGQAQSQEMKRNRLLNEMQVKNLRRKIETGQIPPDVLQGPAASSSTTHSPPPPPKAVFVHPATPPRDGIRVKEKPESDDDRNVKRVKRDLANDENDESVGYRSGDGNSCGSTTRPEDDVNATMKNNVVVNVVKAAAANQCSGTQHHLKETKEDHIMLRKENSTDEYEYFMQEWLQQQQIDDEEELRLTPTPSAPSPAPSDPEGSARTTSISIPTVSGICSEPASSSHDNVRRICGNSASVEVKMEDEGEEDNKQQENFAVQQQQQLAGPGASPAPAPAVIVRGKRRQSMSNMPFRGEGTKISIRQDNPKVMGSQSAARYEAYKAARTEKEFYELGGRLADFKYDLGRGFITKLE